LAITLGSSSCPAALPGAWAMGVDLKEVKTQYTLTGIFCKVVVMGEGKDRYRHNSITW